MISIIRGTVPLGVDSFTIVASTTDGVNLFQNKVVLSMYQEHIPVLLTKTNLTNYLQDDHFDGKMEKTIFTIISPSLDSINYWFLKKSVNLYGEAFVKTIAYEKAGVGSTDTGVAIIKAFWNKNGIESSALNIIDGSGLSPANRVTTNALVTIMQYAKDRPWFGSFKNALPEINGIKMKDGYIGGVRSYTGYIKSKNGADYIFSFIVNNFNGNAGTAREKMWKILDLLK
jgi:D-alanyl-D-alanine carboxypeptidase/D-alanyl-D-alanine-endopeptidase (penicillin-binding protein 4)